MSIDNRSRERKIAALRRLAERPGTEAEGVAARAALERLNAGSVSADPWELFREFLKTGDMDTLWQATCDHGICECGSAFPRGMSCPTTAEHDKIRDEIRRRFPPGTRVYYNKWAYGVNDPAVVVNYPRDMRLWNWARLKFNHLKTARNVPVYSYKTWHISMEPIPEGPFLDLLRGITDAAKRFPAEYAEALRR